SLFFNEEKRRLYIADTGNNRLVSFDSDLNYLAEFNADGGLEFPTGVVNDSKERFVVVEGMKRRVLSIDIKTKGIKEIDFTDVKQGKEIYPDMLAIDSNDNLYVVDKANRSILIFDATLRYKRRITVKGDLTSIADIKVDRKGDIYTLDTLRGVVYIFNERGEIIHKFGRKGEGRGEFYFPTSLAVDQRGLIYVVDQHKDKILIFNRKGEFQFDFSQTGWKEGRFRYPSYIFIDRSDRIYVIDRGNNRIQVFKIKD
ncbi:MAG: NHL repeat-containing protein, partial [Nitrospinae bacterium]|nr:NHL repeat-containing protein [Nitrospinota bacterium]